MASVDGKSAPMIAVGSISGNQPRVMANPEDESETFVAGVPVMLDTDGFTVVWDGTTYTRGIAGCSPNYGQNLTTAGVPKTLSYGSVPNQSSAVNIPVGAPLSTGQTTIEVANDDSVFSGQVGVAEATQAMVGARFGLTIDTDGHFYIDTTKTTIGTNTAVIITGLNENDPRGVYFQFESYVQQLN